MTIEEQVQAEANKMVEDFLPIVSRKFCAVRAAIVSINKIISLRVPPMDHYEQVKQAIINYK